MAVLRNDNFMVAFQFKNEDCSESVKQVIHYISMLPPMKRPEALVVVINHHQSVIYDLSMQYLTGWCNLDDRMPNYTNFMKVCSLCALALYAGDLTSAILLNAEFDELSYGALEELEEALTGDNPLKVRRLVLDEKGDKVKGECDDTLKVGNEKAYLDAVNGLSKMKNDFKKYINNDYLLKEIFAKKMGCFKMMRKKVWDLRLYKKLCKDMPNFKHNFGKAYRCHVNSMDTDLNEEQINKIIATKAPKKKRKGKRGGKKKRGGRGRNKKSQ